MAAPTVRSNGWTAIRRQRFLDGLAECGLVRRAAAHAGMSHTAAYKLRARDAAFAAAWDAAALAHARNLDDAMHERAINGWEQPILYKKILVGTRTRQDNVLLSWLVWRNEPVAAATGLRKPRSRTLTRIETDAGKVNGIVRKMIFDRKSRKLG